MPTQGWCDPASRWLLLAPEGAIAVDTGDQRAAILELRALKTGTPVGLCGRRGLRSIARQAEVDVERIYVTLPDARRPIAAGAHGLPLRWIARSVLTVPSGQWRAHRVATLAVRLCRVAPWLLGFTGQRVAVGRRR